MITISDFAKSKGLTVQAIYNHIKRYKSDFTGHIIKKGRKSYLDDVAVDFLNEHIEPNSVLVVNEEYLNKISSLQDEKIKLLEKIATITEAYATLQKELIVSQNLLIEAHQEVDKVKNAPFFKRIFKKY